MKKQKEKVFDKKSFYKKWWFWAIIVVLVVSIISSIGNKDGNTSDVLSTSEQTETVGASSTEEKTQSTDGIDGIKFTVSNVRNDVTGNWRIAKIAENIEIQEYALRYYEMYFKNDKEIHAIVNFSNNTTTSISVMGNLLNVTVYEYVDKEEQDAKLLFSGMLLKEYHINKENGEIEEIQ